MHLLPRSEQQGGFLQPEPQVPLSLQPLKPSEFTTLAVVGKTYRGLESQAASLLPLLRRHKNAPGVLAWLQGWVSAGTWLWGLMQKPELLTFPN